jgi:putative membrane protein
MQNRNKDMLKPLFKKNDSLAYWIIGILSVVVFGAVVMLRQDAVKGIAKMDLGFSPHIFAKINAVINGAVSVLLVMGFVLVKQRKLEAHRAVMLTCIILSTLFLVSYIAHHLLAPETKFGGEGAVRYFYLTMLASHIILAAVILPFILFTSYQSLSGDYAKHKKIARVTFPIWLYVSVTGVLVYLMISPYYV